MLSPDLAIFEIRNCGCRIMAKQNDKNKSNKSQLHIRYSHFTIRNRSIFPFNVAPIVFHFNSSEIGIQLFRNSLLVSFCSLPFFFELVLFLFRLFCFPPLISCFLSFFLSLVRSLPFHLSWLYSLAVAFWYSFALFHLVDFGTSEGKMGKKNKPTNEHTHSKWTIFYSIFRL